MATILEEILSQVRLANAQASANKQAIQAVKSALDELRTELKSEETGELKIIGALGLDLAEKFDLLDKKASDKLDELKAFFTQVPPPEEPSSGPAVRLDLIPREET